MVDEKTKKEEFEIEIKLRVGKVKASVYTEHPKESPYEFRKLAETLLASTLNRIEWMVNKK